MEIIRKKQNTRNENKQIIRGNKKEIIREFQCRTVDIILNDTKKNQNNQACGTYNMLHIIGIQEAKD